MDPHHHHHCHVIPATCCHSCYTPSPPPPPNPHFIHQNITYPHLINHQNHPFHHHQQQQQHFSQYPTEPNDQATVSSLLRRISALESSLRSKSYGLGSSLRDAAARAIQAHFRSFLVRRSRALRQLKELALIKSALVQLKLSVSDSNSRVDCWGVSRKAMDLLLRIDSIQGGDSMIRDGKRSVSRELDRLLQLIDGFSDKRNKLSSIGLKKSNTRILYNGQKIDTADFVISGRVKRGSKERANTYYRVPDNHDEDAGTIELENFRVLNNGKIGSLLKRNGGSAKRHGSDLTSAKKNVLFTENGNLSRFSVNTHELSSSEDGSNDEEGKHLDKFRVPSHLKSESLQGKNGGLASRYGGHLVKEAKKNVAFSQNGNLSRTFVDTHESNSSEEGSRDEEGELLDNFQVLGNGKSESSQKKNGGLANRHGGDLVKAKKNVTFAKSGDLSRVFVSTREPNSSEDGSIDEERELMDNLCKRVQKIAEISKERGDDDQEEAYSEDEESSQISNDEENSKRISKAEENYVGNKNDFAFSAPTPVMMESKADLMKPQKA